MGTVEAQVGRMRGMFFLSHHPWIGVVVLAILVLAVVVTNKNRR